MIPEARRVEYECQNCRESVAINVLGKDKVRKMILRCRFCGFRNSFYGESKIKKGG